MNDAQLLSAYAGSRSEEAFRALVDRYIRLVYSACWRQLHDRHLAEDASQAVFILLSQRAGALRGDRIAGWLLTACRHACANILKTTRRRQRREQVVAMSQQSASPVANEPLLSLLDEGLGRLGAADREALVLRYLQEQTLRQVGQALGVSEDAARKRVDRGLDKLRRWFARRGTPVSAGALVGLLAGQANAADLAPAAQEALAQGIVQACHASAATGAAAIAQGIETLMVLAKLKLAAVVLAVVLVSAGTGWLVMAQRAVRPAGGSADAQPILPAAPPPRTPVPPTQPATDVTLDLSTPEKALHSLCQASRAGDRKKLYRCMGVDPDRPTTPIDGLMSLNLAQMRLLRAAARAFGTDGEETRELHTLDQALELLFDSMTILGQRPVIDGDSATLTIGIPEIVLRLMPDFVRPLAEEWQGHALHFRRLGDDWCVNIDRTARVSLKLMAGGQWIDTPDAATQTVVLLGHAHAMELTAYEIECGKLATWAEAQPVLRRRQQKVYDSVGPYTAMWITAPPAKD